MKINKARLAGIAVFIAILGVGLVAGYIYFSKKTRTEQPAPLSEARGEKEKGFAYMRIYYPLAEGLEMEERRVTEGIPIEEAVLKEFFKGTAGRTDSYVPQGVSLLGTYLSEDGILYIDLSDEFGRNFRADAMAEFLLLRGLYESIISNVKGIKDIRVLIEGKERESLGGHLSLEVPLSESVAGGDNEGK